jgi:hypothetical protein
LLLTTADYPDGVGDDEFCKTLAEKYAVVVADGLGSMSQNFAG